MFEMVGKWWFWVLKLRFVLGLRYEMLLVYLYPHHISATDPVPVRIHGFGGRCAMLTRPDVHALGKINQVQAETTGST